MPVLNKISREYQKYSSKRLRAIELQNNFFTNQIKKYKKQSIDSIRKAQEFAIENELTLLRDAEIDKEIPNAININSIRVNSSNIIRNSTFNSQLEKLGNDPDKLLYFGRLIEGLNETNLPSELREIGNKLSFARLIYTEEDDTIQNLLKTRKNIIDIFKKQAILILNSQKSAAEQQLKLAERPKGTILKYNDFIREAEKDKATLDKLESEYRLLLLERAKGKDPWNLITNPTVFDFPVAPQKKIYYLIGLIAGFSTGSLTAILLAKYQDLIYRENELKNFTQAKVIQSLPKNDQNSWIDCLDFVFNGVLFKKSGKTLILASREIQKRYIEKIDEIINKFPDPSKFRVSSDYKDLNKFASVILLAELKVLKKEELKSLMNFISISNLPLLGIIVIKEYI